MIGSDAVYMTGTLLRVLVLLSLASAERGEWAFCISAEVEDMRWIKQRDVQADVKDRKHERAGS